MNCKKATLLFCLLAVISTVNAQIFFDESSSYSVKSIEGNATWETTPTSGDFQYNNNGTSSANKAILYSTEAFQAEEGFVLNVDYTTGSLQSESHNLSFGLISDETDLSTYAGTNPFKNEPTLYSIGVNITEDGSTDFQGINFANGSSLSTLDQSGTRAQFLTGESTKITLEISYGGYWCYRINGVYEASGVLAEGIDLTKNYRVAIYGQADNGGGKSIQSIELKKNYAAGERAEKSRGTWASVDHDALEQLKDFKTLDYLYVRFNTGASTSADHMVPHKLLERIALEGASGNDTAINLVTPTWGNLNLDEPEIDVVRDQMLAIKAAGFKVKAYVNSAQFSGDNGDSFVDFANRWFEWCDTDPEAQAFINSQPFYNGTWDGSQYVDVSETLPKRRYIFCYAEFVLKDYALRYGNLVDSWIFDSGNDISNSGDNATSGTIEEQRIYQAFANAVHAGNPEATVAFNNSRSTANYPSYPFAHAIRFEDMTFGHAFGGNGNHAEKVNGNQFNLNYQHISKMTATNGYVHDAGRWDWDDKIVGNFHSKLGPISWAYSNPPAWEQNDFNQWNLEAMQAGASMTWSGATSRANSSVIYSDAYDLLKGLDEYLCQYESPITPNWARAHTLLPEATIGEAYYHVLLEGKDFWDPEGDDITMLSTLNGFPAWLQINEDPENPGQWILSGIPTGNTATRLTFELQVTDSGGNSGTREVEIQVNESDVVITDPKDGTPVWTSDLFEFEVLKYKTLSYSFIRGKDFADFDGDELTITTSNMTSGLSLEETAPDIWLLSGTPKCTGLHEIELDLSDGKSTISTSVQINVVDPQFLDMTVNSIKGKATWSLDNENYTYNNSGVNYDNRSLLYSTATYQSNEGFKVTIDYTAGTTGSSLGHAFSFGLIRDDIDLSTYTGFNPFNTDLSVYSLGINLIGETNNGLIYTDGTTKTILDQAGTNIDFPAGESAEISIEIHKDRTWNYTINGTEEASGILTTDFDLTKSYSIAVYGQDDNGEGKSIHGISLETCLDNSIITNITPTEVSASYVYPNPTSGIVNLPTESNYEISDAFGNSIKSGFGNSVNISNKAKGVYILRITTSNQTLTQKIIKY